MTLNAELALAAREMNAFAARLPEADQPDLAEAWEELTNEVDSARSDGAAELAIVQWRAAMRERLGFSPSSELVGGRGSRRWAPGANDAVPGAPPADSTKERT